MGGRYYITNRGKDEEIAHSTHLSRSMGERIRKEHIFINSIPRQGWGKCSSFENFFSHNRKQNVSIFMKHICSVSKENIFLRECLLVALSHMYQQEP